jgi:hypothetical protein
MIRIRSRYSSKLHKLWIWLRGLRRTKPTRIRIVILRLRRVRSQFRKVRMSSRMWMTKILRNSSIFKNSDITSTLRERPRPLRGAITLIIRLLSLLMSIVRDMAIHTPPLSLFIIPSNNCPITIPTHTTPPLFPIRITIPT